jgi:hypothetical protein
MSIQEERKLFVKKFVREDAARLQEFRTRFQLDAVVAAGKTEVDKLQLLAAWTCGRLPKFGKPSLATEQTLEILEGGAAGHTFYCAHYALVMTTAALALGWEARLVSQRRADYPDRVSNHNVVELWSREHKAWIMFDPTHVLHFTDLQGRPLNCYEIGREWFLNKGRDLRLVTGAEQQIRTVADLPILESRHPNYGWKQISERGMNGYACLAYVPTNRFLETHQGKSIERWDDWSGIPVIFGVQLEWRPRDTDLMPYYPVV